MGTGGGGGAAQGGGLEGLLGSGEEVDPLDGFLSGPPSHSAPSAAPPSDFGTGDGADDLLAFAAGGLLAPQPAESIEDGSSPPLSFKGSDASEADVLHFTDPLDDSPPPYSASAEAPCDPAREEPSPPPYQQSWADPGSRPEPEPADALPARGERPSEGARKFLGRLSKQAATISKQAGRTATKMYQKAQKEVRNLQDRLQEEAAPAAVRDPAGLAGGIDSQSQSAAPPARGASFDTEGFPRESDTGRASPPPAEPRPEPAVQAALPAQPPLEDADLLGGGLEMSTAAPAAMGTAEADFFAGNGGAAPMGGHDVFGNPLPVGGGGGNGLGDSGLDEMAGLGSVAPAPTTVCAPTGAIPGPGGGDDDDDNPERAKLRAARLQRQQDRIQSKLAEQMEREMMAGMLEAEKDEAKVQHNEKLKAWEKSNGDNIRSLLANLGQVLWDGCSFKPPGVMDLVEAKAVKRIYRRAIVVVHPDKVIARGGTGEQNYIASFVYDVLNQAWQKFESEEMK